MVMDVLNLPSTYRFPSYSYLLVLPYGSLSLDWLPSKPDHIQMDLSFLEVLKTSTVLFCWFFGSLVWFLGGSHLFTYPPAGR